MPQHGRKAPFSGKAKKAQLQEKRDRKMNKMSHSLMTKVPDDRDDDDRAVKAEEPQMSDVQFKVDKSGRNRFVLQFKPETKQELAENREKARQPLRKVDNLTISSEMFFGEKHDFPQRPPWQPGWTKQRLEANEEKYFREYVNKLLEGDGGGGDKEERISYFELNLETWRQLWRVVEMSDIILLILDIRYFLHAFCQCF